LPMKAWAPRDSASRASLRRPCAADLSRGIRADALPLLDAAEHFPPSTCGKSSVSIDRQVPGGSFSSLAPQRAPPSALAASRDDVPPSRGSRARTRDAVVRRQTLRIDGRPVCCVPERDRSGTASRNHRAVAPVVPPSVVEGRSLPDVRPTFRIVLWGNDAEVLGGLTEFQRSPARADRRGGCCGKWSLVTPGGSTNRAVSPSSCAPTKGIHDHSLHGRVNRDGDRSRATDRQAARSVRIDVLGRCSSPGRDLSSIV